MNKKTIRIIDLAVLGTIVVGVVTFSLVNILVSNSKYRVYENEYNAELQAVENAKPKGPESVEIDNDFVTYDENKEFIASSKSIYPNIYTCRASEAEFKGYNETVDNFATLEIYDNTSVYGQSVGNIGGCGGGYVSFKIDVAEPGDADIDFVCSAAMYDSEINASRPIVGLTKYVKWTINNIEIDASHISLPSKDGEWFNMQNIILKKVHLKAGKNVLKMETKEKNPYFDHDYVLPNISHIHVFSEKPFSKQLVVNGDSVYLIKQNSHLYYTMTGSCVGYLKRDLRIDLCRDSSSEDLIYDGEYFCTVKDGHFLIKVLVDNMDNGLYFPHFWLFNELYNSGRVEGDVMSVKYMDKYSWDDYFVKQTLEKAEVYIKNSIMVLNIN